ncbi:response regulator transcription factor [Pasteurellaceae bacterium 20609_3]|uniref:response regulator transcription factor n=1 Tax=Spirabiliibacterium mucosae TaxID=28156 RepID=UPI001AAD855D|nr:response regulator transcription factor [Spirabiliibacterium mucosae]MBE2899125.1 response regulator transcription factor [Spirabiliibacterium mucosae]
MRILLVEDDAMIAQAVSASLKAQGYALDWVNDGDKALNALALHAFDVLLLDLGLPKRDGLSVLREVRQHNTALSIIIATARDDVASRVAGLDGGADDYVVKPFDMAELCARLRAVVRRKQCQGQSVLSNGVITLDLASQQAHCKGQSVELTHKEFALLQILMQQPGKIFSRPLLEEKLYPWGEEVESNAVDFLIHALRKKLGKTAIRNVRGAGWQVPKEAL